jgi:hypothetical protein
VDVFLFLHPFHPVQHQKGERMAQTLQKFFPLLPLGWRIRLFRVNLGPPGSKGKSENIISCFGGGRTKNLMGHG